MAFSTTDKTSRVFVTINAIYDGGKRGTWYLVFWWDMGQEKWSVGQSIYSLVSQGPQTSFPSIYPLPSHHQTQKDWRYPDAPGLKNPLGSV